MDEQQTAKQIMDSIRKHPYITAGVIIGVSMYGYFKFIQQAVYTGTLKANRRTVEYLSWVNNQVIY